MVQQSVGWILCCSGVFRNRGSPTPADSVTMAWYLVVLYLVVSSHTVAQQRSAVQVGEPVGLIGREGEGPGEYRRPTGIDSADGHLYVSDELMNRISVFTHRYVLLPLRTAQRPLRLGREQ